MSIRKALKYRIYPHKETESHLLWVLSRCRELYHAALTERRDAYNFHVRQHPNYYDTETRRRLTSELTVSYHSQQNDLPEIKAELREEFQEIAAHVLQDVLRRLDRAFQAFFRRVRNGETPGYPRFKGRDRYDSFTYPDLAGWKFDGWYLHLSKIGSIKVKLHRPLLGKIKTVIIKREGAHWFVVFSCELEQLTPLPISYEDVGIDLGVTHLATLSSGEMIEHPRSYRHA